MTKLLCVFSFLLVNYCVKSENDTTCFTPNKDIGTCLPINDCPLLSNAVLKASTSQEKRFLKESFCGWQGQWPKVCCGARDFFAPSANEVVITRNRENRKDLLPDRTRCGFQDTDKILGGTIADIMEFPWTALLVYNDRGNKTSFKCGGVLINEKYVLTSAHCRTQDLSRVRLGEWNINNPVDCVAKGLKTLCSRHVDVDIESVKVHENYRNDRILGLLNDIALIRLKESVNFTTFIQPICLPASDRNVVGEDFWVTGWGVTNLETFATSDVKQKVTMKVISLSECKMKFNARQHKPQIDESHVCALGEDEKSSCLGDSGNPFVTTVSEEKAQFYVEGIVSYGGQYCNTTPVVFTRVYPFLDWIRNNVKP